MRALGHHGGGHLSSRGLVLPLHVTLHDSSLFYPGFFPVLRHGREGKEELLHAASRHERARDPSAKLGPATRFVLSLLRAFRTSHLELESVHLRGSTLLASFQKGRSNVAVAPGTNGAPLECCSGCRGLRRALRRRGSAARSAAGAPLGRVHVLGVPRKRLKAQVCTRARGGVSCCYSWHGE